MKITLNIEKEEKQKPSRPSWRGKVPGVHRFTLDGKLPKPYAMALYSWLSDREANPTEDPDYDKLITLFAKIDETKEEPTSQTPVKIQEGDVRNCKEHARRVVYRRPGEWYHSDGSICSKEV